MREKHDLDAEFLDSEEPEDIDCAEYDEEEEEI